MTPSKRPLIIIAGATASGKSHYARVKAQTCNGVIINADSLQVYAALPILTAQPSAHEKQHTPHRMYDFVEPPRSYDVQQWLNDVKNVLNLLTPDQTPILVGGTGFYLDRLCFGLNEMPIVPRGTIIKCEENFREMGGKSFHDALFARDPVTAQRLHPNDRQRLIRAMSVIMATGIPFSTWQQNPPAEVIGDAFSISTTLLLPERTTLQTRAEKRFHAMIANGALDEVAALITRHPLETLSPTLGKAIGVRPIYAYLSGEITREEMIRLSIDQTNQYLKRQSTWFRNQKLPNVHVVES